jgi:hypothetical protein
LISLSLPRLEAGEHLDLELAVGALLEFLARPHRPLVVRLRGFIDVGPLELGLGLRHAGMAEGGGCHRAGGEGLERETFLHSNVSL